ncbi:MAG TPA: NAD(P)-dependent oxidoreductase [Xanthomonadaceae bacterium]|nr:NAD(P)-dependent oxidoreductase [Xanthomonadaceae bacterium]
MKRKAVGDIAAGRLPPEQLAQHFADVEPPLDRQAALVEANRCLYCYDAPCIQACPTGIQIPHFIRRIATEDQRRSVRARSSALQDQRGAAEAILSANIFGGSCARVCPTEILCEADCVRNVEGDSAIRIGALQRYATDWVFEEGAQLFSRKPDSGRRVAVVGAGPAGLACAHALAREGHRIDVFEARARPGGLNEYGIAAYKVPDFVQSEIDWLLSIGGIELQFDQVLGSNLDLAQLCHDYDAVFLGIGLGAVNRLGLQGGDLDGVRHAVDFIAELRQCRDLSRMPVGRRVVVIGGGNTAIDAAVQSRRLGAERVTLVYRRGAESMSATHAEQAFARSEGVTLMHWAKPNRILSRDGQLTGVEFEYTELDADGRLVGSGDRFNLLADSALVAIGQALDEDDLHENGGPPLHLRDGRIAVDEEYRTSLPGVWAGGDCVGGHTDLTVQAVEDGKRAAASIHRALEG